MAFRSICLALQGGGSHGAYTWGVLERLLEHDALHIEAISGASAGAMNATVVAHGYMRGGRKGAIEALEAFWESIIAASLAPYAITPTLRDSATHAYVSLTRYFSPAQLNPLKINPLRDIVEKHIDFERLRKRSAIRLFISATRVSDGTLKLFTERELTADALLASACVPSLHHPVLVDGEAYWDGAITANPPLSPLVYQCAAPEILLVSLTPAAGSTVLPSTADAIIDRVTQIGFCSSVSTELHSIALAKAHAERARFAFGSLERRLRRLRLHTIELADGLAKLDVETRFKTDGGFIHQLRALGREHADEWVRREWPQRRVTRASRTTSHRAQDGLHHALADNTP